jgi:CheY-like chemotaxis protein
MTLGPISVPADPPCRRRTPPRYEPAAVTLDQSAWAPASSSVVDDGSHVRAELRHCLGHEGFRVLTALEGDHVLQLLHVQPVDAITLDVRMPHPDGLEVCGRLRGDGDTTLILLLTAHDEVADRVAG